MSDIPTIDRPYRQQGKVGLYDWKQIAEELKRLPDGKAKLLTIMGKSPNMMAFRTVVREALKRHGVITSGSAIDDKSLAVWENRDGAA